MEFGNGLIFNELGILNYLNIGGRDALRFQRSLVKRLDKFSLKVEATKTKLVEFGRFATRDAKKSGRKQGTVSILFGTFFD